MPPPTSTPIKPQPQKQSHKTHPQNTAAKHSDKNTASNAPTKTYQQKHTHKSTATKIQPRAPQAYLRVELHQAVHALPELRAFTVGAGREDPHGGPVGLYNHVLVELRRV